MQRVKNYIFGKPEPISYRISQTITLKRPYPLLKLLHTYSENSIEPRRRETDPFYHWRATIHQELRTQVQNLALLEAYYKHHEPIPTETPEGLEMPQFRLDVRPSQIRGAGKGLYLTQGKARTGQVICCYPGLSYFYVKQGYIDQYGLNLRWSRGLRDHLLTLEGQIWIDANPRLSIVTHTQTNHMWAKGQFINHPTHGFTPNVVPVVFDWGPDFVSESSPIFKQYLGQKRINLERFVPNEFAWEFARMESEWIPGAVFVALRDIEEGEEIFYDYEWEHNINYVQYSQRGDILIDWPWYQTVPQSTVDVLIEPWLSYRDFLGEINRDWRLKKTDTIAVNPGRETMKLEGNKERDDEYMLEMQQTAKNQSWKEKLVNTTFYKGLLRQKYEEWKYLDDNVEPVPKPKVERKERRRPKLIAKDASASHDEDKISVEEDVELKLTSNKRKKLKMK
mmetsp:Transcript_34277/g.55815  ORF Transcript_34277/g.55815 Transcript_34277/m.55815 type:complete len:451 (-) Transcript_34277:226-1578(-)